MSERSMWIEMDHWIEVNVAVTHEAVEVVSEILTEAGSKVVAIEVL